MPGSGQESSPEHDVRRSRLLDLLPDAVLLLDADLKVVDHNGVAHRWLGLDPSADLYPAAHPDDVAMLRAAEVEARHEGVSWTPPVPVRMRHADGSWHTWSVTAANRLRDPVIGAIVVLARDVTGRATVGMAQADVLLRELATEAPVALLTLDL
jgi:HTH-type transcriptional regulator, bacterioopsin transcriptional activator and related proteins